MGRVSVWLACVAAVAGWLNAQSRTDTTKAMLSRLTEEADAFRRIAPSLLGQETLKQKAHKPKPRFRPRIGESARQPPPLQWQDREIVSEYAFIAFPGQQESLHELRRVLTVDGRNAGSKKSEESLARIISLKDEQRERELLEDFHKHGLVGAVTDLGPLLMLFTPREVQHFEFELAGQQMLRNAPVLVFRYSQIDGASLLSLYDTKSSGKPHKFKVEGEVWVRQGDYLPVRVTLSAGEGQGETALRETATVDYTPSSFGALVPLQIDHKELVGGQLNVENSFVYSQFHRFGADSSIHFETTPARSHSNQ